MKGGFTSENGRAGEIRTHDLLHPMQARYQATLQPEQGRVTKLYGFPGSKCFFARTIATAKPSVGQAQPAASRCSHFPIDGSLKRRDTATLAECHVANARGNTHRRSGLDPTAGPGR